jgi:hypothetical protein
MVCDPRFQKYITPDAPCSPVIGGRCFWSSRLSSYDDYTQVPRELPEGLVLLRVPVPEAVEGV